MKPARSCGNMPGCHAGKEGVQESRALGCLFVVAMPPFSAFLFGFVGFRGWGGGVGGGGGRGVLRACSSQNKAVGP